MIQGLAFVFAAAALFVEVPRARSGLNWTHENGRSPERYLPETVGPGGAFLDYDGDGDMDVYLVGSGPAEFYKPKRAVSKSALYRNNGDGTFADVTKKAGVAFGAFGMGAAAADYDNDGDADLFVTSYDRVALYRNKGDGTFEDVARAAGLVVPEWTTSAAFFDFDGDGDLDLFVCRYVVYGGGSYALCGDNRIGKRYYCTPKQFKPQPSLLFENKGDGTFREIGHASVIGKSLGKGLGVVTTDVDDDGRLDLFVANDTTPNFLFVNKGRNLWTEVGFEAEVAFGATGKARSGMGTDAADYDQDGRDDLFVANIEHENFSLYRNEGDLTFDDEAGPQGIAQATFLLSGWGLRFLDYDNDAWPDLFLANGHPDDMVAMYYTKVTYEQPMMLYRNVKGRFENVTGKAGPVFAKPLAARGLATGDFDDDGRVDVLVTTNGGAPLLLRNTSGAAHHWIGVKLQGTRASRDAVGARITWSAGGTTRTRRKVGGGSYLSSHDPREVLGLGTATKVDWVDVRWPAPSNRVERFTNLSVDRYVTLVEGKGVEKKAE